jgi:hypothetical protein
MSEVYNECTCCFRPLTPEELEHNKEKDNLYYTICNECIGKSIDQLFKIINEE